MKDKLVINTKIAQAVREKAELAGVTILSETNVGDEIIMLTRFRNPASLFSLAKYIFEVKKVKQEKTDAKNK